MENITFYIIRKYYGAYQIETKRIVNKATLEVCRMQTVNRIQNISMSMNWCTLLVI